MQEPVEACGSSAESLLVTSKIALPEIRTPWSLLTNKEGSDFTMSSIRSGTSEIILIIDRHTFLRI